MNLIASCVCVGANPCLGANLQPPLKVATKGVRQKCVGWGTKSEKALPCRLQTDCSLKTVGKKEEYRLAKVYIFV